MGIIDYRLIRWKADLCIFWYMSRFPLVPEKEPPRDSFTAAMIRIEEAREEKNTNIIIQNITAPAQECLDDP
jgi:hypothetical protein